MRILIGGLSWDVTDDDIASLFGIVTEVQSTIVQRDRNTGWSKGFGFITTLDALSGLATIVGLNGVVLRGRPLVAKVAGLPEEGLPGSVEAMVRQLEVDRQQVDLTASQLHSVLSDVLEGTRTAESLISPSTTVEDPESAHLAWRARLIEFIDDHLIEILAANPRLMYQLSPRRFEMVCAELLTRFGFDVRLTARSHDGGVDMFASRNELWGTSLVGVAAVFTLLHGWLCSFRNADIACSHYNETSH